MMVDYEIKFDSSKVAVPIVIVGNPPVDQSAALAAANTTIAAMQTAITAMKAAAKAEGTDDAATVAGAAVLAAAGPF